MSMKRLVLAALLILSACRTFAHPDVGASCHRAFLEVTNKSNRDVNVYLNSGQGTDPNASAFLGVAGPGVSRLKIPSDLRGGPYAIDNDTNSRTKNVTFRYLCSDGS